MTGENDLQTILKAMLPELNVGEYIFFSSHDLSQFDENEILGLFKEKEGATVIISKEVADRRKIPYNFVASWITLTVHSSLSSVGLTAAFSTALAKENISANIVAGYYHDHIFVAKQDAEKALKVLEQLSKNTTQVKKTP